MAGGALPTPLERALRHVAAMSAGQALDAQVPVTLNFHPDRLARGRPVLDQLAADGRYLSQFATGTSNGGLTAYPAGDRWRWESRIFGAAYDEAPARDRPVYGALNFRGKPTGGAQRFGSAHFRLVPRVLARTTFCYPDSFLEPSDFGVASAMALIVLVTAGRSMSTWVPRSPSAVSSIPGSSARRNVLVVTPRRT